MLVLTAVFLLVWFLAPRQGLLAKAWRRVRGTSAGDSPHRRRWLLPTTAAVLLLLAAGALGIAALDPAADAALDPGVGAGSAAVREETPVSQLADRAWVVRTAAAAHIPEPAMAAYAGAAVAVGVSHPSCRLGWNTLAAIGQTATSPDAPIGTGPMRLGPAAWSAYAQDGNRDGITDIGQIDDAALTAAVYLCETGGDLSVPTNWTAALTAYNASKPYDDRVAQAAQQYAAVA